MVEVVSPEQKSLLLAGYVLGDLSIEEGHLLVQLLAADPSLRSELDDLQASFELAYGATAVPPADLKASVLSGADLFGTDLSGADLSGTDLSGTDLSGAEPSASVPADSAKRPRSADENRQGISRQDENRQGVNRQGLNRQGVNRQWAWRGLGALAASLIVALMVQNQGLRRQVEGLQAQQVIQPVGETINVALSATDVGDNPGQVSLVIDPTDLNAVLVAEGLQPLAADQVYALWTVVAPGVPVTTDEKGAILTAVFTVDDAGSQTQAIDLPGVFASVEDVKAIAVSIEDANVPQAHQSSPILRHEL